jgi:Ca2+-binding RTX toxin-like protein
MRRVVLTLAAMALALLLASGVAWAVNKVGTDGPDTLRGTHGDDNLLGKGGNDELFAQRGNDNLLGGPGKDVVTAETERGRSYGGEKNMVGGPGNDGLWVWNRPAGEDVVTCGSGFDRVFADRDDTLAPGCERVFVGWGSVDEFFESFPESFFRGLP